MPRLEICGNTLVTCDRCFSDADAAGLTAPIWASSDGGAK